MSNFNKKSVVIIFATLFFVYVGFLIYKNIYHTGWDLLKMLVALVLGIGSSVVTYKIVKDEYAFRAAFAVLVVVLGVTFYFFGIK